MKLKLGTKIITGYLLIVVFLGVVAYFGITGMQEIVHEYTDLDNERTVSIHVGELSSGSYAQFSLMYDYILTKQAVVKTESAKMEEDMEETFKSLSNMSLSESEKSYLEQMKKLDDEFKEDQMQIFKLVDAGKNAEAAGKMEEIETDVDKMTEVIQKWDGENDNSVAECKKAAEEGAHSDEILEYIIIAVSVVLSLGIGIYISRSISKPVAALTAATSEIAEGNLGVVIPDVNTKDEVETLNNAFKVMVNNLRQLISGVTESAQNVAATSEELSLNSDEASKATQQVANAMQEIARGASEQTTLVTNSLETVGQVNTAIQQIAGGAQEQANSISLTADMVNQMAVSIREVASSAQTVSMSAEKTREAADQGEHAVGLTIQGMGDIKEKVFESANKIRELGEHSQQIGEIIQVIDDIAEQTNLLALNAAIEAARAGEHGKGFAVVADEVRKLAERSSKATKEIADLITNIQKLTAGAVTAMEQGTREVEQGANLAVDAGEALKQIMSTVEETYHQVQNISASAEEISASSQEVVKAIDNVSAITQENTAATEQMTAASTEVGKAIENVASVTEESSAAAEEVSASTEEMTASIEEINAASHNLATMAENLRQMVAGFKL